MVFVCLTRSHRRKGGRCSADLFECRMTSIAESCQRHAWFPFLPPATHGGICVSPCHCLSALEQAVPRKCMPLLVRLGTSSAERQKARHPKTVVSCLTRMSPSPPQKRKPTASPKTPKPWHIGSRTRSPHRIPPENHSPGSSVEPSFPTRESSHSSHCWVCRFSQPHS